MLATDGSEHSKAAAEKALEIFGGSGSAVFKVISVYENVFPVAGEPFAISADYYQELEDEAKKQAELFAETAASTLRNEISGIEPEVEVRNGSPGREIVEAAVDWNADVIVVGSHGRGFWGRMMVGSVSDAVMHHAPCSVLIVRRPADPG
ncbi:MAG: universal stress protein [Pyrinomonadaceae bacterium]|nr:universal stress protein [Pyrinomonadaceae bacterium]